MCRAYHSLGYEDENLESSLGWWAATVATYCPSRTAEHPKSKSTGDFYRPDVSPCTLTKSKSRFIINVSQYLDLDSNQLIRESNHKTNLPTLPKEVDHVDEEAGVGLDSLSDLGAVL